MRTGNWGFCGNRDRLLHRCQGGGRCRLTRGGVLSGHGVANSELNLLQSLNKKERKRMQKGRGHDRERERRERERKKEEREGGIGKESQITFHGSLHTCTVHIVVIYLCKQYFCSMTLTANITNISHLQKHPALQLNSRNTT